MSLTELLFTSPSEAYERAGERLEDTELQERVAEYLGGIWPEGFEEPSQPQAVFAPYLARGSELEVQFVEQALEAGFVPTVATYEASEYVTANSSGVDCYRPPLKIPKGQRSRDWVVPEDERPGELGAANTIYEGLDIVGYWAGLRNAVMDQNFGDDPTRVTDFGDWYKVQAGCFGWNNERSKADKYYNALMALYASGRAVLWDTPPTRFATSVMLPAANRAWRNVGAPPLLTCELRPEKRDWVDLSFLSPEQTEQLKLTGTIE